MCTLTLIMGISWERRQTQVSVTTRLPMSKRQKPAWMEYSQWKSVYDILWGQGETSFGAACSPVSDSLNSRKERPHTRRRDIGRATTMINRKGKKLKTGQCVWPAEIKAGDSYASRRQIYWAVSVEEGDKLFRIKNIFGTKTDGYELPVNKI